PGYGAPQQPAYGQPAPGYGYGAPQQSPYAQPAPGYGYGAPVDDKGSFGWAVLGFFIPLIGLILFLVWKDQKPGDAKMAGMGALVSVIASVALWLLIVIIGVIAAAASSFAVLL
ncbi:hypothetical protein BSTEL_1731, partial [Bifidobacterium stellenboschense]